MAKNTNPKKPQRKTATEQKLRRQQIIFFVFAVVLIISMVASMFLTL